MKTKYWEFLNEVSFDLIETNYEINYHVLNNLNVESYDFISNKDNNYSVYFMITKEEDEILSNDEFLSKYTQLNNIPTIFFSLTEKGFGKEFDTLTNNKEYLEVMGKVVYLILEFINKHNYTTYSIGEVSDKKMNFYNYYRKHFRNFSMLTGLSSFYKNRENEKTKVTYMIKLLNVVNVDEIKLDENLFLKF